MCVFHLSLCARVQLRGGNFYCTSLWNRHGPKLEYIQKVWEGKGERKYKSGVRTRAIHCTLTGKWINNYIVVRKKILICVHQGEQISNMLKSGVVAPFCSPALGCLRRRNPCRIGASLSYTVRLQNNKKVRIGL